MKRRLAEYVLLGQTLSAGELDDLLRRLKLSVVTGPDKTAQNLRNEKNSQNEGGEAEKSFYRCSGVSP